MFKTLEDIRAYALALLRRYNLTIPFSFHGNMYSAMGQVRFYWTADGQTCARFYLSSVWCQYLLDSKQYQEIRNLVKHEVAHILDWRERPNLTPDQFHDDNWRKWCDVLELKDKSVKGYMSLPKIYLTGEYRKRK